MKHLVRTTMRGVVKVISSVWYVLFPPDTDVPLSYYRQETQNHSKYLPGVPNSSVLRAWHAWRPPTVEQKPPVED